MSLAEAIELPPRGRAGPGATMLLVVPLPIPIRAHSLLCLLGYRGVGYDAAFTAEMTGIHSSLARDPSLLIEVRTSPDRLCAACPNLKGGCTLGGPAHEAHMRSQDEDVVRRLGLRAGGVYPWTDILDRVSRFVRGTDLPSICTTCPWLPLGWCAEGIELLRQPRDASAAS